MWKLIGRDLGRPASMVFKKKAPLSSTQAFNQSLIFFAMICFSGIWFFLGCFCGIMWDNIDFLYSDNLQCHKSASACVMGRMTRQGFPAATTWLGISWVTTEPEPMTTSSPIVTPGLMTTLPPIQTSEPIVTGLAYSRLVLRTSASMG